MTQSTNRQDALRSWRFLNSVFDGVLILGTGYVIVRLMMLWTQGGAVSNAISTFTP